MSSFITSDTQYISNADGVAIEYEAVIAALVEELAEAKKLLAASSDEAIDIILRNSKTIVEQRAQNKELALFKKNAEYREGLFLERQDELEAELFHSIQRRKIMITYKVKIAEIELFVEGACEVGESVDSFCCTGHAWEILRVGTEAPGASDGNVSLWGHCDNPKCTAGVFGEDDQYKGISNTSQLDLAFWLYDRITRRHERLGD